MVIDPVVEPFLIMAGGASCQAGSLAPGTDENNVRSSEKAFFTVKVELRTTTPLRSLPGAIDNRV